MNRNTFKAGTWNVYCDICRQKKKADECRLQWDHQLACTDCWDRKHPELYPLPIPIDGLGVPDARPRPNSSNVYYHGVNEWTRIFSQPAFNGRVRWNQAHFKWNAGSSSDVGTGDPLTDIPLV
jgi:hypothetical protein